MADGLTEQVEPEFVLHLNGFLSEGPRTVR